VCSRHPPSPASCCSAPPLAGGSIGAPAPAWQPASPQLPPFSFQSRSVMSMTVTARTDSWGQVSGQAGPWGARAALDMASSEDLLWVCAPWGSTPLGGSHPGIHLTLSLFLPVGPAGSRADAGAPEFTFTFRSAHDVFREFFGGRDPFADFFGACGTGEVGSQLWGTSLALGQPVGSGTGCAAGPGAGSPWQCRAPGLPSRRSNAEGGTLPSR